MIVNGDVSDLPHHARVAYSSGLNFSGNVAFDKVTTNNVSREYVAKMTTTCSCEANANARI